MLHFIVINALLFFLKLLKVIESICLILRNPSNTEGKIIIKITLFNVASVSEEKMSEKLYKKYVHLFF